MITRILPVSFKGNNYSSKKPDFFRDYELFDRKNDVVTLDYSSYDKNDIEPVFNNKVRTPQGIFTLEQAYSPDTLELGEPIIGTKKKFIYYEKLIPVLNQLEPGIVERYSLNNIANVIAVSRLKENEIPHINTTMVKEGFKLLKQNYPIEFIVNVMHESKYKTKNMVSGGAITEHFDESLPEFLINFPDNRADVIRQKANGSEYLDKNALHGFYKLFNFTDDTNTISSILDSCRVAEKQNKELKTVDNSLLDTATLLLRYKDKGWTPLYTNIIERLKEKVPHSLPAACDMIHSLIKKNTAPEEILEFVKFKIYWLFK